MSRFPPNLYLTPSQIEQQIKEQESMAAALPPRETRQMLLKEIERLRNYADAERRE